MNCTELQTPIPTPTPWSWSWNWSSKLKTCGVGVGVWIAKSKIRGVGVGRKVASFFGVPSAKTKKHFFFHKLASLFHELNKKINLSHKLHKSQSITLVLYHIMEK